MATHKGNSCVHADADLVNAHERPSRNSGSPGILQTSNLGASPKGLPLAILAAIALTVLFLLAACGSDAPATTTSTPQTDGATSTPPAAADNTTAGPIPTRAPQTTSLSPLSPGTAALTTPSTTSRSATAGDGTPTAIAGAQPTRGATAPASTIVSAPTAAVPEPTTTTPVPAGTPPTLAATRAPTQSPAVSRTSVETDRQALIALYDATSGRFWSSGRNENWLTDSPLNEWHGVSTDRDGQVIGLELRGAGLIGEIPPRTWRPGPAENP